MKSINIERLLEEAKIMYWKENETVIFQEKHIGKQDKTENSGSAHEYSVLKLKLIQEG